jgi:hypothetical protein
MRTGTFSGVLRTVLVLSAGALACESGGGSGPAPGPQYVDPDCRTAGYECSAGFSCAYSANAWSCQPSGGSGPSPGSGSNNPPGGNSGGGGSQSNDCRSNFDCPEAKVCLFARCEEMYGREYVIVVHDARFTESGPDGSWDAFGGLPDPYVSVRVDGRSVGVGATAFDTLQPRWSDEYVATLYRTSSLAIRFIDEDVTDHDVMATISMGDLGDLIKEEGFSGSTTSRYVSEMSLSIVPR